MFAGVCLIFGISAGTSWSGEQHGGMGKSRGGGSGTWVRQPKPGSLGQNVPTGVRPGQVAVDGGVRGEDVGHRQHVAEQPAQGEPQQHLPITRSSGVPLGYGRVPGTAWGGGGDTQSLCHDHRVSKNPNVPGRSGRGRPERGGTSCLSGKMAAAQRHPSGTERTEL